ncbi:solute carrier family 22 member 4-like [Cololabis saira]|uniref:solute carrier family 22 member 4-like n=1 Tax=Cololabis saira TaxID=129043 RepID=UPI002AD578F7|nr:solute carrier family 22 member 4-like [Cololabis saira]
MQDYEEAVLFLGIWGPFQRRIFFLLCLSCVPCGYNLMSVIFLLATPSHHCHIPAHSNLSQGWIQASIPVQEVGRLERSSCSRYELDAVKNLSALGPTPDPDWIQNHSAPGPGLKLEECKDGWSYSTEYYPSTVVTEFDLVCSEQWKQPLTSFFYFLGGLCGCFVSGQISDRFGRKPVLFGSIAILSVFSITVASAPSWPIFTVLFFLLGVGQIACYIVAFVLGSEILVGSTRVLFCSLFLPFTYTFAMMLMPGAAYLVRSWRHLSLTMAVPGLACLPLWWMVPESPRWLVSRGRLLEAEMVLRSAALENRVEAPLVIFSSETPEKVEIQKPEPLSCIDLLKTVNIRHVTITLWLIWFSMNLSYFGLSFSMSSLDGNPFLNYFLITAVEFPAYIASWVAACKLPRRFSFISFSLLGALALLFLQLTVNGHPAITLSLVLLGKFGVMAGSGVLYIYTGELFPTVIRNTAMSSCAMFSRLGSAASTYLLELATVHELLPWIVVGSLSLLSVVLCIFLPETFRQLLPDTIPQMPQAHCFRRPRTSSTLPEDEEKTKDQTMAPEIICTARL